MISALLSRIRDSFRSHRLDEQIDEEVRGHLDMLTERYLHRGMERAHATYAAQRQFGGVTQMKEHMRERRTLPLGALARDFRHALRQMFRAKAFTASAALTLSLGIGASTAVFAVLDAVVLRRLPFAEPDRLMAFGSIDRRGTPHPTNLSYPNFFDFRAQNRAFEHLVSYRDERFTLSDSLPPMQVSGAIVSWDLFQLLRVEPELGRGFLPDEEKPGMPVAVLSHSLWRSRFGGDEMILNRPVRINGKLFTVVGVAPAGFNFPMDGPAVQLWTTLSQDAAISEFTPLTEQRGARVINAIGRLKSGITPGQARSQMNGIAGALARLYPDNNKNLAEAWVTPEQERLAGENKEPLWILLGAVTLVLLIACANVASLLMARSTGRAREFALRSGLGASRQALVRQLLIESLVLGIPGCIAGVMLAGVILRFLLVLAGDNIPIPRFYDAGIDLRVLSFAVALALLTSVLFGLAPAAQAVRTDLTGVLKEGAYGIVRAHHRFRSGLVIGQITVGMVLLVGAELLVANFLFLIYRDPGFRPDHLLAFEIALPETRYDNARQVSFSDRLIERLSSLPGVQKAAFGMPLPLQGSQMSVSFDIEQRPAAPPDRPRSDMAIVSPGYFSAMGIPLLKGRDFTGGDDANAPRVVIVNDAFARKFFPGDDAVGKRIMPGATNGKEGTRMRQIVGVVANAKQVPLTAEADPIYYFPYKQLSWGMGTIVLRTSVLPQEAEPQVRDALMSLDREAPMFQIRTGEELAAAAVTIPRFVSVLMTGFAGIALLLTVVGLYGILSSAVAKRRREIGVRMAVGAGRRQVLGLVMREAMQLVVLGLAFGLAGAIGVQRLLASIAFGIRSQDFVFVAAACCVMVVTSVAAAWLPALSAVSVDPVQALRTE